MGDWASGPLESKRLYSYLRAQPRLQGPLLDVTTISQINSMNKTECIVFFFCIKEPLLFKTLVMLLNSFKPIKSRVAYFLLYDLKSY